MTLKSFKVILSLKASGDSYLNYSLKMNVSKHLTSLIQTIPNFTFCILSNKIK